MDINNRIKLLWEDMASLLKAEKGDLHDIFVSELQLLYWAEQNSVGYLETLAKGSTTTKLEALLLKHQDETHQHIIRLEDAFETIGEEPSTKVSQALKGLIADGNWVVGSTGVGSAKRDVATIMACQKLEHFEIACYGSAVSIAEVLGYSPTSDLLLQTLVEEKEADASFTAIAEKFINDVAKLE